MRALSGKVLWTMRGDGDGEDLHVAGTGRTMRGKGEAAEDRRGGTKRSGASLSGETPLAERQGPDRGGSPAHHRSEIVGVLVVPVHVEEGG